MPGAEPKRANARGPPGASLMRLGADLEFAAARSTALPAWAFRSAPRGLDFCHPFPGAWPIVSRMPRGDLVAKREGRKARNEPLERFPSWRSFSPLHVPHDLYASSAIRMLTQYVLPDSSRHHDRPSRSEGSLNVYYHWPRSASRRRVRHGDNFALAALDNAADVVLPQRQRAAHLALVVRSIVNAGWPSLVPGLVV